MISIIIPAHNEESVIARCLDRLAGEAGELEIVVVCNGCTDRTAQVARAAFPAVKVIETEVASKVHALNLGDAAASGFPRFYLDADVVLPLEAVRRIAAQMQRSGALVAAPAVQMAFLPGTSRLVRAYYRLWMALPYVQEGLIGSGVYAISQEGRSRFDRFPALIADDGFVRMSFTPAERIKVADALCTVWRPRRFWQLVRIKTRSRLGFYQLRASEPELFTQEAEAKRYGRASAIVLRQPRLWASVLPYLLINLVSRWRASRQLGSDASFAWERDDSSRTAPGAA